MNEHHDDAASGLRSKAQLKTGDGDDPESGQTSRRSSGQRVDQCPERRAELLGAAVADDLSPAEQLELDAMCAQDPQLAQERDALCEFSASLPQGPGSWHEETPPGALGSLEPLATSDRGVILDGVLIAHARGTTTAVELEGLTVGDTFTMVLVAADGQESASESFLGSEAPAQCRMSAATPREDVERLEIRSAAGLTVLVAELHAAE